MNWILLVVFLMKSLLKDLRQLLELIKKYVRLKDFLYDDENKCAYLEYPDGRRVYVKD